MKTQKSILNIILAVTISGLVISGCKKKDEEAPAPTPVVSVVPNGSQSQQTQKVNDQTSFDDETNKAMDDAINALEYCSKTRDIQALCNTTVDTTFAAQGKITLTYTGNDCLSLTSRSGSIIIQFPYNGTTLTTWTTAGSKAQLTFVNYKVTRLSNNKSLTFNGYHAIKNVNGGGVIQLLAGATILHQIRADMQITFDDGTSRTWLVAKTRTFTNVLGLITNTIAGDTTFGSYVHAAVWGTNRLGQPFTVDLPTSVAYYLAGTLCLYRPHTGVLIHYASAFSYTITYGVDILGNPVTFGQCPYGYKFNWIDSTGTPQQIVLPY